MSEASDLIEKRAAEILRNLDKDDLEIVHAWAAEKGKTLHNEWELKEKLKKMFYGSFIGVSVVGLCLLAGIGVQKCDDSTASKLRDENYQLSSENKVLRTQCVKHILGEEQNDKP